MTNYTFSWNYEDAPGDTIKEKAESLVVEIYNKMPSNQPIIVKVNQEISGFFNCYAFPGKFYQVENYVVQYGRLHVFLDNSLESDDLIFGDEHNPNQFRMKIQNLVF